MKAGSYKVFVGCYKIIIEKLQCVQRLLQNSYLGSYSLKINTKLHI